MKKLFLLVSLVAVTLLISGCGEKNIFKKNDIESENKVDCRVDESLKGTKEGDRYVFTFVDGYVTEQEVSVEFDTKEEAQEAYDSLGEGTTTVLDGNRLYYIREVPEGEKYTREEVIERMEAQDFTCK